MPNNVEVADTSNYVNIPIIGRVAAGRPGGHAQQPADAEGVGADHRRSRPALLPADPPGRLHRGREDRGRVPGDAGRGRLHHQGSRDRPKDRPRRSEEVL